MTNKKKHPPTPFKGGTLFVILNEVKNLCTWLSLCYDEILHFVQNDMGVGGRMTDTWFVIGSLRSNPGAIQEFYSRHFISGVIFVCLGLSLGSRNDGIYYTSLRIGTTPLAASLRGGIRK